MPIGATIGALGSVASAGIGAYASSQASNAAQQSAQQALQFQQQAYAQNQSNLNPFITTGQNATYSLASLYGLPTPSNPAGGAAATNAAWNNFTSLPAYQFPLQQGSLALERQLNAQGRQLSGAQVRGQETFGQGLASQYLMSNYVNPLQALAGQGATAAGNLAQTSTTSANNQANTALSGGQAAAAGDIGVGNSLAGGISNLALYSALGRNSGATAGTPASLSSTYSGSFNPTTSAGAVY